MKPTPVLIYILVVRARTVWVQIVAYKNAYFRMALLANLNPDISHNNRCRCHLLQRSMLTDGRVMMRSDNVSTGTLPVAMI